jgi:sn-glycerol 3-phosphate transport system ATP-binding protein
MGRAIVRKPQVFLFDEPLSNLDAKLRVQMRVEIKKLQRALGVTSIYVTHDQVEAMTLSDKLVVMSAGRVEQVGLPNDVYRKPASRFVATFIGSPPMNIAKGMVRGKGAVSIGDVVLPVSDMAADLVPGAAIEVGLRPEDLIVTPNGSLTMAVDFIEELGATQLFHGTLGGAALVIQAASGLVPSDSKTLNLTIDPAKVHLFDVETGVRRGL